MSRYVRHKYDYTDLQGKTDEAANRLIFDWWCDEGDLPDAPGGARCSDRLSYIADLNEVPTRIPSRAPHQDDPCPPITVPAPEGFRDVYLLSHPDHVRRALTDTDSFCNRP